MPKESLHLDYGLLTGFLRSLSFRFQLRTILESLLLSSSGLILVLLGGRFVLELRQTFPYLPFVYSLSAILFLSFLFLIGLWRLFSRPSVEWVARGLEKKFPQLRDDVTNSLLLVHEIEKGPSSGQISEGLITAQVRKTAHEVCSINHREVVSLKAAFKHLRLLLPLALTFSLVFALDPYFLSRSLALIIHPLSHLPVRKTSISVEPRGSIILRGAQVVIRAKATGDVPDKLALEIWPEGGEALRFPMEPEGEGRFTYKMASVQSSFQYQAYGNGNFSAAYSIRVVDPPELGKMKLRLVPPDYTGLPVELKETGHIEALKGTMVTIEAEATKVLAEGKMVLNQGNELLLRAEGNRLTGGLLVLYPAIYFIKMKDDLGFENPNPVQYQIRLIPDKYPEVEILSPAKDLEISGSEVIPIIYKAKDDFGITAVRLSYQIGGIERSVSLKGGNRGRFFGPETYKWDLSSLALTAGDRIIYRLEVSDNDSVSGPKIGYSQTFTLFVRDERARVAKEGEEAQQIADALLNLLADQLEEARDKEDLTKNMEEILNRVDRNLEKMKNRVERFDLEALRRNLSSLRERVDQETKERVTQEMERLALLAEDIAKRAKMNEVEALAREMRNRQRRLVDSINDLKERDTQEGLDAVMKELKKVEELLRSIMEALSKLATGLPEEFINSQELSSVDFQDLLKDLEEIQKRLAAGDTKGALEMAQKLLQALSEMMAALGRAATQAGMAPFDRLQGEMSRQAGELQRIVAEQKEILGQTEMIDRETRKRVEEETEKRLSRSLTQFEKTLEKLKPFLPREQGDLTKELGRLLKEGKLKRFFDLAGELDKKLSAKGEVQKIVKELKEMVEGLGPDFKEAMAPDDRMKFPDLSLRQDNLKERTGSLREKLEILAQLFPGMDTEILTDLKEATGSMGEASGKLGKEDAPGAIPPEQEAIRRLTKSEQAMQQMAQQMAMRMQAARWGYQWDYDPRPGWYYGPWVPMPTLPQPEVMRPREKGFTGIDREEFDPPSKDDYKVPKIFREKVMESLKEEVPSQYKREVEKYFKGLTE
jgi:ribosome-associated translation inhibitor RaiA